MPGPLNMLRDVDVVSYWRRDQGQDQNSSSRNGERKSHSFGIPADEMGVFAHGSGSDGLQSQMTQESSNTNEERSLPEPSSVCTDLSSMEYVDKSSRTSPVFFARETDTHTSWVELIASDNHQWNTTRQDPSITVGAFLPEMERRAKQWLVMLGKKKFQILEEKTGHLLDHIVDEPIGDSRRFIVKFK